MRLNFLIGLLLVFLFTLYTGTTPTESPGVNPIAWEQADEVTLNPVAFETINLAEVVIVPGLSPEAATENATREQSVSPGVSTENAAREQSVNLINGRMEVTEMYLNGADLGTRYPSRNITKAELKDNFMLNHKLVEISPGDRTV